ncbi:MAG: SpaA isopeptide-forming pilin-related protein, partial [Actinomycetia bacterium]|nr:SpaA isopeptide-forming pilin-related protein [Actinomycetes bacterium]
KQTAPRPHGRVNTDLLTTISLSNSSLVNFDLPAGTMIEIFYDATRINQSAIRVTEASSYYTIDTSQAGKVVLTFFDGFEAGENIEASIIWRLITGPTEEYQEFPLFAHLIIPDSSAPDGLMPIAQANVVSLSGTYGRPFLTKYANGQFHDYHIINFGYTRPDGSFSSEETRSITYTYKLSNVERNLSEVIITDYLPSYTTVVDGVISTATAHFDPEKNPGWVLVEPGVVSFAKTQYNTTVTSLPRLILDFPNLRSDQVINNSASFVATPYNMASTEAPFTGRDSILTWASSIPLREIFGKDALREYFYDYPAEKSRSFTWKLTVSGFERVFYEELGGFYKLEPFPDGQYLDNISITDDLLDIRMRYIGVDVGDFKGARVTAYDSSGTVLFEASNQSGKIAFPVSICDDIARIEITDSGKKVPSGKMMSAYVITELRDPSISISDFLTDPMAPRDVGLKFPNYATMDAELYDSDKAFIGTRQIQTDDFTVFQPFEAGLGISKTIKEKGSSAIFTPGDELVYYLNLDLYDDGVRVTDSNLIPNDDVAITDVIIYDVLPIDFVPAGTDPFVPSNYLMNYSTGLSWKILPDAFQDADGWHDVLEIKADSISPFMIARPGILNTIGSLRGTISELAFDRQYLNHVYFDFTQGAFVWAGQTSAQNPYLAIDENPFGAEALWGYVSSDVVTSKYFASQKEIRTIDSSSPTGYGPWSRDGVKTPAGSPFQYRLRLRNNTDVLSPRTDVVVVDVFPYVGDVGIARTNQQRFSQFENCLDDAGSIKVYLDGVELFGGYTLSYMLDPLPSNYPTYNSSQVDAYLDNSLTWSASYSDARDVKGIRVDLSGISVNPGQEIEVRIDMLANSDLGNIGLRANNSFVRKDSVQTSYLEAPKVYNEILDKPAEIRLRKREGTTSTYLNGAVFGLYLDDGSSTGRLVQVQTTVATVTPSFGSVLTGGGWIVFTGIERGNYFIQEITPPSGYELNTTRYPVYFNDFVDPNPASYSIPYVCNKYSSNSISGQPIGTIPQGTAISNTLLPYYGSLVLHKTDGTGSGVFDGNGLTGVRFSVRQNSSPNTTYTAYTDSNGIVRFDNLLVTAQTGVYTVTEEAAPGRLTVMPPFTVTLNRNGTITLQSPLPAGAQGFVQLSGSAPLQQVDIANTKASVRIMKLGIIDDSLVATDTINLDQNSGIRLGNVEFTLHEVSSTSDVPSSLNQVGSSQTTISSGTNLGTTTFVGLKVNQLYAIQEVATPLGYLTLETPSYFKIDGHGAVLDALGRPYKANTLYVKNEREEQTATLIVEKVDAADSDIKLADAQFVLEKWDDDTSTWNTVSTMSTSAPNGQATINGLTFGAYRISEVVAPSNYIKLPQSRMFFVDKFVPTQMYAYTFENTELDLRLVKGVFIQNYNLAIPVQRQAYETALSYLEDAYGAARVFSIPQSDGTVTLLVGLENAVFEMKEYEGSSVSSSDLLGTYALTSDSDGMLQFAPADAGFLFTDNNTYTFQEVTAPTGYKLQNQINTWRPSGEASRLIENGGIKWFCFENYPEFHHIVLSKYAVDTGSVLSDAEFELLYPNGDPVYTHAGAPMTFMTDMNGRIELENLAPGTYYLHEVEAPTEYSTPEGYWRIIIEGDDPIGIPHDKTD